MIHRNLTGWTYVKTMPRNSIEQEFKGCSYDITRDVYLRITATERLGRMAEGEAAYMVDEPRIRKPHIGMPVGDAAKQAEGMVDVYVFSQDEKRLMEEGMGDLGLLPKRGTSQEGMDGWYARTVPEAAVRHEMRNCAAYGENAYEALETIEFHGNVVHALVKLDVGEPRIKKSQIAEYVNEVAKQAEGMKDICISAFQMYPTTRLTPGLQEQVTAR